MSGIPAEDRPRQEQLEHLEGSRCLAAFWIVCAHYLPKGSRPAFNGAVFRVNVAVCFFVVTSGFVTHWAYSARDLSSFHGVLLYYTRRLGRVVLTFWLAMAFACCTAALSGLADFEFWYLVRCFLLVEQWVQWCPNGPSWFVFAMLPAWLLYPLTHKLVLHVELWRGGCGLAALFALLWIISFGPGVVLFVLQEGNITMQQHHDMSFWPPSQLADFALGVCTAALAQRRLQAAWRAVPGTGSSAPQGVAADSCAGHLREDARCLGRLADVSLGLVLAVVFLVPRPPGTKYMYLTGWEPLLDHGLAPLFALFMYCSCFGDHGSLTVRLLRHEALVGLGAYSFEAYIFQRPVHDVFRLLFDPDSTSVEAFLAFLLGLWLCAGLYARFVQAPLDRRLRAATSRWPHAGPAAAGAPDCGEYEVLALREAAAICPAVALAEPWPGGASAAGTPPL